MNDQKQLSQEDLTLIIGQRLREFMEIKYNSVQAFASVLGIKPTQLSRWFSRQIPNGYSFYQFYQDGCSLDWLMSGKGRMFADNEEGYLLEQRLQAKFFGKSNAERGNAKKITDLFK